MNVAAPSSTAPFVPIFAGPGEEDFIGFVREADGRFEAFDVDKNSFGWFANWPAGATAIANGGDLQPRASGEPEPQPKSAREGNTPATSACVPAFDHTTALEFYKTIQPGVVCILGYKHGRRIASAEQLQALAQEADDQHNHLFFHVATVSPTWTSGTTATKEQVLECPYLWGDCDATKYTGNDPIAAAKHYADEGSRISQTIDEGLRQLGIDACAKWRSGAGWQFLVRLDQAVTPDEAETLVGKLHTALGFDPVVRNCNRILRVPGSVNWKNGKDGRVPSECLPVYLHDTVSSIDDVRRALANVATKKAKAKTNGAATETTIDWSKVKQPGWLQSVDDLPGDISGKLRRIIGHTGNLASLNDDMTKGGLLHKPYESWSDVTFALATLFKFYGSYTPEEIAEALSADFPCNQHITRQEDQNSTQRAIERAITRSQGPKEIAGVTFRDFYESGRPKPSLANAVIAIRALGIAVSYDRFRNRVIVEYNGEAKTISEGILTDDMVSATRSLINNTYRIDCGDNITFTAIREVARDNAFDPILDLLDACQAKWDGVKRIDTWTIVYLGCEDTPLHRAFGRLTLIAACRRPRVPGCKFDTIPNLEGSEGTNKSTMIRTLAGDDYFSDESIIGANSKEVQEQLDGKWMHENADLAGMRKADVDKVNVFASRQVDRARPAYGRVNEDRPRRSIEWGTINQDTYLLRQTGNRRWWPLKTTKIDLEAFIRDREQLLGEAATYEAAGESITLDEKLWSAAREAQEQRRVIDPWEDILADIPNFTIHKLNDDREGVTSEQVLSITLGIPKDRQTSMHTQRLAVIMGRTGWKRERFYIDGKQHRGFTRQAATPAAAAPASTPPQPKNETGIKHEVMDLFRPLTK